MLNCGNPQNPFYFEDRESNTVEYFEPIVEDNYKTNQNPVMPQGKNTPTGGLLKIIMSDVNKYIHRLVNLKCQKEDISKNGEHPYFTLFIKIKMDNYVIIIKDYDIIHVKVIYANIFFLISIYFVL